MNALQNKVLLVAVASVTTRALMQAPSAQNTPADAAKSAMEDASRQAGISPKPSGAVHSDKADAAMATPNSLPTEADRKAAAAMSK